MQSLADRTAARPKPRPLLVRERGQESTRITISTADITDIRPWMYVHRLSSAGDWTPPGTQVLIQDVLETSTGYGDLVICLVAHFAPASETWEWPSFESTAEPEARYEATARDDEPDDNAARRALELSGLEVKRLASIFGISRQAYHGWMEGARPRGTAQDHLLEVVSLLEEANNRLGESTRDWLLKPAWAGGVRPLDMLEKHQVDTFRGAVLASGRSVFGPAVTSALGTSPAAEERAARRRLSPPPFADDLDGGS